MDIMLNGFYGKMEAKYHEHKLQKLSNKLNNPPIALVMHPDPTAGGTMNNKVVYSVYHTFIQQGFTVLRFNFSGVGKSGGECSDGEKNLHDATIALDWLQSANPSYSSCWVAGFSFGAHIAMNLTARRPEIDRFIIIAPPVEKYEASFSHSSPASGLVVQGDKDEIVLEKSVANMASKLAKKRNSNVVYELVENADHFFTDKISDLNNIVSSYIDDTMSNKDSLEDEAETINVIDKKRALPREH